MAISPGAAFWAVGVAGVGGGALPGAYDGIRELGRRRIAAAFLLLEPREAMRRLGAAVLLTEQAQPAVLMNSTASTNAKETARMVRPLFSPRSILARRRLQRWVCSNGRGPRAVLGSVDPCRRDGENHSREGVGGSRRLRVPWTRTGAYAPGAASLVIGSGVPTP